MCGGAKHTATVKDGEPWGLWFTRRDMLNFESGGTEPLKGINISNEFYPTDPSEALEVDLGEEWSVWKF